jgi:hypothetical protein
MIDKRYLGNLGEFVDWGSWPYMSSDDDMHVWLFCDNLCIAWVVMMGWDPVPRCKGLLCVSILWAAQWKWFENDLRMIWKWFESELKMMIFKTLVIV